MEQLFKTVEDAFLRPNPKFEERPPYPEDFSEERPRTLQALRAVLAQVEDGEGTWDVKDATFQGRVSFQAEEAIG